MDREFSIPAISEIDFSEGADGKAYLLSCHLVRIEVFSRREDEETGRRVRVNTSSGSVIVDDDMGLNRSSRRGSVVLHFQSEVGDDFKLVISQHKGVEQFWFEGQQ